MRPTPRPPEINVTPLVDVVLVLLIIFMVVIPQLESGAAITVPPAGNPDPRSDLENAAITVALTAGGDLFLEKAPIERAALVPELRALHAASRERPLIIKGDGAARYQDVRALFRDCQTIGFPGVALEVGVPGEPTEPGEEG